MLETKNKQIAKKETCLATLDQGKFRTLCFISNFQEIKTDSAPLISSTFLAAGLSLQIKSFSISVDQKKASFKDYLLVPSNIWTQGAKIAKQGIFLQRFYLTIPADIFGPREKQINQYFAKQVKISNYIF